MTKEEAKKQIEQWQTLLKGCYENVDNCKSKIDELQAIIDKPDRWQDSLVQPDKEEYFYLMNNAYNGIVVVLGSEVVRKPEHAFRAQEQAELIKEKILLMQEMYAFAHVRNEGWMPDWGYWGSGNQEKHGIACEGDYIQVFRFTYANLFVFGVAVKSREIAEEMLEIFGERIERFYNKMY